MPLGGTIVSVFSSETASPSKHIDPLSEEPPKASQKTLLDCQSSVSLEAEELTDTPPLPCNEGAKGEFEMKTFWHSSQTFEQKLLVLCFDMDEFPESVELQRTGTGRGPDCTLNSSAENGSHVCK